MQQTQHPSNEAQDHDSTVTGGFVSVNGVDMYRITNVDRMPPFLVSVVSDSDHWMYVSTSGGMAAGRVEPSQSLFPYETDDRIYRAGGATGPFTLLRVQGEGDPILWEPFTDPHIQPAVNRNLYKGVEGDSIIFEETRADLGMTFRYRWDTSDKFGFVRTCTLISHNESDEMRVDLLDGLRNVIPANVPLGLQQTSSTLVEAYRRNEVDRTTGLAIYSLESRISDRAEPAESLHANIVWSTGLPGAAVVLDSNQIKDFRAERVPKDKYLTKGTRAHYLLHSSIVMGGDARVSWRIVADVHQTQLGTQLIRSRLRRGDDLDGEIDADIDLGSDRLRSLIASADGWQLTADRLSTTHHFANTLFNSMRGGVFVNNGSVPIEDLGQFIEQRNRAVHRTHASWLDSLGISLTRRQMLAEAEARNDPDLERLCHEYLPLTFSRRHGDPSRPWNMFAIKVKDTNGDRVLDYQGNWRDIFQNWEALCYSFPDYLESIVAKFVNASTVDGYNPYRVTREGIDWEAPDPENPWSNIGYWGDHQIIYLLRLLEALNTFDPGALSRMLGREVFSYADVPYRIRPYDSIVRDSKNTIDFDRGRSAELEERSSILGSDGKLVTGHDGTVLHVTLAEKLVVPALSKLANLVVDGGIWMNTQRPEWNDANNALVGYGTSMVTLAYLRRYLNFCERLFSAETGREFLVSTEVATWLEQTVSILTAYEDRLDQAEISDRRRKRLLDRLGSAFSEYRAAVYDHGFSGKAIVRASLVAELCRVGREYADHSIRANRVESGLFHSYNLVRIEDEGRELAVDHLYEMLEGQVATISSGLLDPDEIPSMIEALSASPLYRDDQNSFMLYPHRQLPGFLAKNSIPGAAVEANPLLAGLLAAGDDTIIEKDTDGVFRFAPAVASAAGLAEAMDHLSEEPEWTELVAAHRVTVDDLFEDIFEHRRFTGRSGSMYKYEGLGSIYWHMVAKLLLAVQEVFWQAHESGSSAASVAQLADAYYRIRSGLSSEKSPTEYGAFPTDPYSHSPSHMGAQQPGMTGQVKEEILTRWGELGVRIKGGAISFDPSLLRMREFISQEQSWTYADVTSALQTMTLPAGSLAFTFCQVPITYRVGDVQKVEVTGADGRRFTFDELRLDEQTSRSVFERRGEVAAVEVVFPESLVTLR